MKKPMPKRTPRTAYTIPIRDMKPKGYLYFAGANPASIKAIASRLGVELDRVYFTQKEAGGVNCWRES